MMGVAAAAVWIAATSGPPRHAELVACVVGRWPIGPEDGTRAPGVRVANSLSGAGFSILATLSRWVD